MKAHPDRWCSLRHEDAPGVAPVEELTALASSAELACCELDQSASVIHGWLRQRWRHDAVTITVNGSLDPVSQWHPALEPLRGRNGAAPSWRRAPCAAGSRVTIEVVLGTGQPTPDSGTEAALHTLAHVIAARVGRTPPATDTAPMSIAHAVAVERDGLTRERPITSHQHLETILGHLRDDAAYEPARRIHWATTEASRALADLRERRAFWQQARRVDAAFALVEREIDELARAAGVRLECTLAGRPRQLVANTVLDAAAWISPRRRAERERAFGAARGHVAWSVTDDELEISIVDDGRGFDAQRAAPGGLRAMRRRTEVLGGSLQIESVAGWGTHVRACLRLQAESAVGVDESASALVRTLGDRELEVLRLMAVGHRNRDIAAELALSQHTVKFHVARIFEKLGVRSRAEAAAVAFAAGIHPRPKPDASASHA